VVESDLLWEGREPPPRIHLPAKPTAPRREWERLRDEIEDIGFQDGVRDVLHFAPGEKGERQLAAWWKLAEIADDRTSEDQAAIDDYLRGLAPAGMVYVPAGPFLMGSADDDPDARDNEKPQHEVALPGYYIGRTPVTNEAYAEFIAAGGYETRAYWTEAGWNWKGSRTQPEYWNDENRNQPRQPVVGVSWYESLAYCRWRGLRLPTEAEWEKAAGWDPQAGRKRRYPWGDEWDQNKCEVLGEERAAIVGKYSLVGDSFYGLSDMAGNVLEWCSTRRAEYPYRVLDGREDLEGGDDVMRVLRSSYFGSYPGTSPEVRARCAYRSRDYPWGWGSNRGLRVSAPRRLLPRGSDS